MENKDIRKLARVNDIPLWKIANGLGITDSTFSKWLRKELSDTKKQEIILIINELKEKEK